jgi:hypothetical protein
MKRITAPKSGFALFWLIITILFGIGSVFWAYVGFSNSYLNRQVTETAIDDVTELEYPITKPSVIIKLFKYQLRIPYRVAEMSFVYMILHILCTFASLFGYKMIQKFWNIEFYLEHLANNSHQHTAPKEFQTEESRDFDKSVRRFIEQ